MVNEDYREMVRQFILPVILDHGVAAHRLAATLYRKYGILSTLCGERQNPLDLLDPNVSFLSLAWESNPTLATEQLIDFSHTYDRLILILIPMTEKQARFVQAYGDMLESRFVLSDPEAVFRFAPLVDF
jgi:hypothetical protein